jgi:hypothetical protein
MVIKPVRVYSGVLMWRQVIQQLRQRSTQRPMFPQWSARASCQASTRAKPLKALRILLAFLICKVRHLFQYAFQRHACIAGSIYSVFGFMQSHKKPHIHSWTHGSQTLGNTLTVTGFTTEWLAVQNDLPPTDQLIAGRYIYGRGTLVRIETE